MGLNTSMKANLERVSYILINFIRFDTPEAMLWVLGKSPNCVQNEVWEVDVRHVGAFACILCRTHMV